MHHLVREHTKYLRFHPRSIILYMLQREMDLLVDVCAGAMCRAGHGSQYEDDGFDTGFGYARSSPSNKFICARRGRGWCERPASSVVHWFSGGKSAMNG